MGRLALCSLVFSGTVLNYHLLYSGPSFSPAHVGVRRWEQITPNGAIGMTPGDLRREITSKAAAAETSRVASRATGA